MPRQVDIPEPFCSRPFRVADAKRAGLTQKLLAGPRFRGPFNGVKVPASLPETFQLTCQAASLAVSDEAAFSHETAALLFRLPVSQFDGNVDVMVEPDAVVPQIRGVDGHTGLMPESVVAIHDELKAVHPEWTFFHLAATWPLDDLVILGDAILRNWSSPERMATRAVDARRRRGIVRAREALRLARPGVDSSMETRTRLLIIRAGLPCPDVNLDIIDDTGAWLARPDLAFRDLKIAIEYDGDHHRTDQRQWRRDRFRDEQMRDAGWIVITLTADDVLRYPQRTLERIRHHYRARLVALSDIPA